jgi:hypothetical protein
MHLSVLNNSKMPECPSWNWMLGNFTTVHRHIQILVQIGQTDWWVHYMEIHVCFCVQKLLCGNSWHGESWGHLGCYDYLGIPASHIITGGRLMMPSARQSPDTCPPKAIDPGQLWCHWRHTQRLDCGDCIRIVMLRLQFLTSLTLSSLIAVKNVLLQIQMYCWEANCTILGNCIEWKIIFSADLFH